MQSTVSNKRMINLLRRMWAHNIYIEICTPYLKDQNNTIEMMENILLLMQLEYLRKYNKPFYRYKSYIYNNQVSICYISDLLRVSPIVSFVSEGLYPLNEDKYMKIFKKYNKKTQSELELLVANDLKNRPNYNCIIYGKYQSNFRRQLARLKINEESLALRYLLLKKAIGLVGIILCIVGCFAEMLILQGVNVSFPLQILIINLFGIVLIMIWIIWTWRMTRPSIYEIENGFTEK